MYNLIKLCIKKSIVFKKILQIVLIPIILIPLVIFGDNIGKCSFVIAMMILYWILECIPIAITGLIPLVFYPVLGIMKSKDVSMIYFSVSYILFY